MRPETYLAQVDPALGAVIDKVGAFRIEVKPTESLFVAIAQAIVYQQLSGKAAATIYARVCALFARPSRGPTARALLAMDDKKLRAAGLSAAKTLALKDLAKRSLARSFPTVRSAATMSDAQLIEALSAVRGVGCWTVQMFLIFRLGRADVWPVDDYGVKKAYAKLKRKRALPTARQMHEYGQKYAPFRTAAAWYLWRSLEL